MKLYATLFALVVFVTAAPVYAQIDGSASTDVRSQTEVTSNTSGTTTGEGSVNVDADVNADVTGSVDTNGSAGGDTEGEARGEGSVVSVSAVEVRGWDAQEKQAFLATVKAHAQVQSEQDLEAFAKGVIAADGNVEAVATNDEEVRVSYRVPAKFLGIFEASIPAEVLVRAEAEAEGRVEVRFPWYKFLFSVEGETNEAELKSAVESRVNATLNTSANANAQFALNDQARISQEVSAALKAEVDAAANATGSVQ